MVAAEERASAHGDWGTMMDWTPTVRFSLDDGAYPPGRAHDTDAGSDLRTPVMLRVPPHDSAVVDLGVHVELPPHACGLLVSKSGLNVVHALTSTGLIDQGYSGPMRVRIYNDGPDWYLFRAGDKVTQIVLLPVLYPTWRGCAAVEGGERGDAGFGSTGR